MPRGRKAGFKHSPETIEKMKGKRKQAIEKEVDESIKEETKLIEVPAM
jgi:hypothetical protein